MLETDAPRRTSYDVVIVGGAMYGSSVASALARNPDFDGSVLVVERDPTYAACSTTHTNSCVRQQFSNAINIQISQYTAEVLKDFPKAMGGHPEAPRLGIQSYGYMYLADTPEFADTLRANQKIQHENGAHTRLMTPDQILAEYPFYNVEDVLLGSHNPVDEGYFDGITVFDWFRRTAREGGVEYLANEVVAMSRNAGGDRVESVTLKSGEVIGAGQVVNASGPRGVLTARMLGIEIPVEPRKRYTFIFDAEDALEKDLPLTIDPSGVHMRSDGQYYLAGCPPDDDPAVDYDDYIEDHTIWQDKVWPVLAARVPAFERIKLVQSWVGHYAFNTLDQNAIVGPHTEVSNFFFLNGFSGHGLQQSPALGRGLAELLVYGGFRTLDLTPFGYERIKEGRKFLETAVI